MVHRAAWALSVSDPEEQVAVSMGKYLASKAVNHACRTALQCHGAIGYTMEYDLQIWLKRGWALAATRGDAIAHIDVIGRNILNDEHNQPMDKESLHAARKLRRSFHALARKVLNHNISVQKLDEITERLETIQNEIPAAELPKWWQPETGSGELRSSTYRNRSLYQGPTIYSPLI